MALAVGFVFSSCGDDNKGSTYTLDVTTETTELFQFSGGSRKVTVTTEGYWAVEADQQWVTFDPIRGDGNG